MAERISQDPVEVAVTGVPDEHVSQFPIEIAVSAVAYFRVSQFVVEALVNDVVPDIGGVAGSRIRLFRGRPRIFGG